MFLRLYTLLEKLAKFFIGQTSNVSERLKRHNAGIENYTAKGLPWELVWKTSKNTRAEAMALEKKFKNLSQVRIIKFMEKYGQGACGPDEASVSGC